MGTDLRILAYISFTLILAVLAMIVTSAGA